MITRMDEGIGAILRALEEAGVAENTVVIFTSDNGSPARDGTAMSGPTRLQEDRRFIAETDIDLAALEDSELILLDIPIDYDPVGVWAR